MLCPEIDFEKFEKELFRYISEEVITLPIVDIQNVYSYLKDGFSIPNCGPLPNVYVRDKSLISRNQRLPGDTSLLGIDFPIWFNTPGENKDKVMILGIDPLRNEKVFKNMKAKLLEQVIIGTPYGLHEPKFREGGKQKDYWHLIRKLSDNNFVYLTDIYKTFFYTTTDQSKRIRSYDYYSGNGLSENHISLLKKEIELIKPDLIVTFGGISYSKLMNENRKLTVNVKNNRSKKFADKYPVLPMVHLSARQKNKIKFLHINSVEDKDRAIGEGYYQVIEDYLIIN